MHLKVLYMLPLKSIRRLMWLIFKTIPSCWKTWLFSQSSIPSFRSSSDEWFESVSSSSSSLCRFPKKKRNLAFISNHRHHFPPCVDQRLADDSGYFEKWLFVYIMSAFRNWHSKVFTHQESIITKFTGILFGDV